MMEENDLLTMKSESNLPNQAYSKDDIVTLHRELEDDDIPLLESTQVLCDPQIVGA